MALCARAQRHAVREHKCACARWPRVQHFVHLCARGWCHRLSWTRCDCPEGQRGHTPQDLCHLHPLLILQRELNKRLKRSCLAQHQFWVPSAPRALTVHENTQLQHARMGKTLHLVLPKRAAGSSPVFSAPRPLRNVLTTLLPPGLDGSGWPGLSTGKAKGSQKAAVAPTALAPASRTCSCRVPVKSLLLCQVPVAAAQHGARALD